VVSITPAARLLDAAVGRADPACMSIRLVNGALSELAEPSVAVFRMALGPGRSLVNILA
jgi:hypothetical protein